MDDASFDELKLQLVTRGYRASGADAARTLTAPNDTMAYSDSHLRTCNLGDLLDLMVLRREKGYGSGAVVGVDAARATYEDACLFVDALKAVING